MIRRTPEEIHRRAARALGQLSFALTRGRLRRDVAESCIREFREAADALEILTKPRDPSPAPRRRV